MEKKPRTPGNAAIGDPAISGGGPGRNNYIARPGGRQYAPGGKTGAGYKLSGGSLAAAAAARLSELVDCAVAMPIGPACPAPARARNARARAERPTLPTPGRRRRRPGPAARPKPDPARRPARAERPAQTDREWKWRGAN